MRSFRASGILDEGNDVDPSFAMTNDRERLLPRSVIASKSSTATTTITANQPHRQAHGNIRNITNTISNVRGRLLGKPPKYPRSPTQNSMQQKETKYSRNHCPIQTKGNYENLQQSPTQPSNALPQPSSSASLKPQPQSSSMNNSPQSLPEKIIPRTTPPNKILEEQTNFETSYRDHEYDHEYDDYHNSLCNICCDEDGCNFQLSRHCNEGMKNLCTIAIWAMLVFAIVNRFLMHMGMFYARGRSVGRVRNGMVDGVGREVGAVRDNSENGSGKRNVEVRSSYRVDFDIDSGAGGKRLLDEEIVVGANVGTFLGREGDLRGMQDIF